MGNGSSNNENLKAILEDIKKTVDKLDNESWWKIFFVPLMIAFIGVTGSVLLTQSQNNNLRKIADDNIDAETLRIFFEYIDDDTTEKKRKGLRLVEKYFKDQEKYDYLLAYVDITVQDEIQSAQENMVKIIEEKADQSSDSRKNELEEQLAGQEAKLDEYKELDQLVKQKKQQVQETYTRARIIKPR